MIEIENLYKKYEMSADDKQRLVRWDFARRKDQRSDIINNATKEVAKMIMYYCPDSWEKRHGLMLLEMVMVNANLAMIEHENEQNPWGK